MAAQITFTGTVAHNDDAEFPFVAEVVADGQVLARYPVRTSAAGRAKLDEAFAMLTAQAATPTDAACYEELSDIIAWLDAMPHSECRRNRCPAGARCCRTDGDHKATKNIAYPHSSALAVRLLRLHHSPALVIVRVRTQARLAPTVPQIAGAVPA
jgi:hypothetical protein